MYHRPAPILAEYSRGPVDVSPLRRAAVLAAKALVAAAYGAMVVLLPPNLIVVLAMPIVGMLLLTLWMLPDRGTFPRGLIERVFPYYLSFSVLWPVYLAIALPGLPWATPTRVLLFALTFLLLYSVSTSSALRHHLITVARVSTGMWVAFLLWEAMQVITLPFSQDIADSVKQLFDNLFRLSGIMFLGCLLFTRRGWGSRTIGTLILLAVITSVDGFVELKMGSPPWANYIPSFMRVDEGLLANVLGSQSRTADGLYRVRGPFPNSLLFAEFLALCVPFIVHDIVMGRSLVRKFAMIVTFFLVLAAIVVTQSRLGLVGVLVTLICYLPLWALRRWRADRTSLIGPAIILGFPAIAALMMGVVLSSHTLSTRVFGGGAQAASTESRRVQREMAVPRILHNPIGYGLGQSGKVLGFVNPGGFLTIDSNWISTVLDLGVVGFFSFFGLCFIGVYQGAKLFLLQADRELQLGGPIAVSLLVFVAIKFVSTQENNHPIIFLLFGMLLAFTARARGIVGADGLVPVGQSGKPVPQETPMPAAAVVSVPRIAG